MLRSRIVAWLRVILPLTALALLSVLFLFGRHPEPQATIPYADVDPRDLAERQAITNPTYTGVTSSGAKLTVTGREAVPGKDRDSGRVDNIRMTLRTRDGQGAEISAGTGSLQGDQLALTDGARMTTADGWVVTSPEFHASTRAGTIAADQEVNVLAPFGRLTAGSMELRPVAPEARDHILDLKGGVRLIYQP